MTETGEKLIRRSFDSADEVRPFEQGMGEMQLLNVAGSAARAVFRPGWRWSEHVKPIAQTDSCQVHHVGYVISGRMHIRMNDGTEDEFGAGDLLVCPPGHDAWIIGDETCVILDWGGPSDYAKRASS